MAIAARFLPCCMEAFDRYSDRGIRIALTPTFQKARKPIVLAAGGLSNADKHLLGGEKHHVQCDQKGREAEDNQVSSRSSKPGRIPPLGDEQLIDPAHDELTVSVEELFEINSVGLYYL